MKTIIWVHKTLEIGIKKPGHPGRAGTLLVLKADVVIERPTQSVSYIVPGTSLSVVVPDHGSNSKQWLVRKLSELTDITVGY